MKFGVLFTSQPHKDNEPYPHQAVHSRVTKEIVAADRLGFDSVWIAEHHFSTEYGIMPDVWVYGAYLAALTKRIKLGMGVVVLPLANPVRVVENASFIDVLSNGRLQLGVGSGYRKYEFDGFGLDFDQRREMQDEGLAIIQDLFRTKRTNRRGKYFSATIEGDFEMLPHPLQQPYPPLFMAAGTDRSISTAGKNGFGLKLSTLTPFDGLARQVALYRQNLHQATAEERKNPGCGEVNIARWVYVADTDAEAKKHSEEGLMRHLRHFASGHQSGYLGQSSQGSGSISEGMHYDTLAKTTIIHGSPATVRERIEELRAKTGLTSLLVHYPPWYGADRIMSSLQLFAGEVMPYIDPPAKAAE